MKKLLLLALALALALSLASCGEVPDALLTVEPSEDGSASSDTGLYDEDFSGSGPSDAGASDTGIANAGVTDQDGADGDAGTGGDISETVLPSDDLSGGKETENGPEGEKEPSDDLEVPGDAGSNDEDWKPEYNEYYYDVENVVLYLEAYDELPPNYITKEEANDLGWSGGSVENYMPGAAIGGDRFGNYEGLLPKAQGRTYTECDIDTDGYGSRGARRLVFSNDGLYFYTDDHYETFREVTVENGEVEY